MGIPSWAKYSFAADDFIWFGPNTEVFGEIRSNKGIRFDGLAHNLVSSAKDKYSDPSHGGGQPEFGVHTHVNPVDPFPTNTNPPTPPNRPDVFMAGRTFPVGDLDFSGLTSDLSQLKTKAQSGGLYFASSGAQGYNIVLKTDNTFDLYKVTSLVSPPSGCTNLLSQSGWGTWSIQNQTLLGNYPIPSNGIVFWKTMSGWREKSITDGLPLFRRVFPEAVLIPALPSTIIWNIPILTAKTPSGLSPKKM